MIFKAGDVIKHLPSGETWVLAFGNREDSSGKLGCAGWPLTVVEPSHCELVESASEPESEKMLDACAKMKNDIRGIVVRNYLARVGNSLGK